MTWYANHGSLFTGSPKTSSNSHLSCQRILSKMRVNVIGTRGFPYIQGGVERHCESLYPLIALKGCKVKVFRRTSYIHKRNAFNVFRKVRFCDLWTLKNKSLETIIHSLLASIICYGKGPILFIYIISDHP